MMISRFLAACCAACFTFCMTSLSPAPPAKPVDDYQFIQLALDSAALHGGTVVLPAGTYTVSQTLHIAGGVTLAGAGRGASATATPNTGTIIKNTGTGRTIRITGDNAGVQDLVVYDTDNAGAAGGIVIEADATLVESVVLRRVLIHGFTDGEALLLDAKNGGGIGYCSFYDVRVRHAHTGIAIRQDAQSFVNSNTFYHGAISGGGFAYGLHVMGGNNNVFNALIIEPYTSTAGHLVVEAGQVVGHDIRIEGAQQPVTVPLISFAAGTYNSFLSGLYSGGLTLDEGDNYLALKSAKSLDAKNSGANAFVNAAFHGVQNNLIPCWQLGNSGMTAETMAPEILPHHQVVKLTIPAGLTTYLRPEPAYLPGLLWPAQYDHVNFGAYVKTDRANLVTTTCKAPMGVNTGLYHPGDDQWRMVGMTSAVSRNASYDPKFYIDNSQSATAAVLYITTPTLSFGDADVQLAASPINSAGGIMTGTLSTGLTTVATVSNGLLTLPRAGNVFEITGTHTISRINHQAADRFPKGTCITLLFNEANVGVANSAYIKLIAGFSATANSSLTLISMGDGTWRELNRNK